MTLLSLIIKSLFKRKTTTILLILQIAVTLTILINACFVLIQKQEKIDKPSGIDEQNTFSFTTNIQGADNEVLNLIDEDLQAIRKLDSVANASQFNAIPYSEIGAHVSYGLLAGSDNIMGTAGYYLSSYHGLDTLNISLVAGQRFEPNDITVYDNTYSNGVKIIISKALASALFPSNWRQALGETLYVDGSPDTIVGIADIIPGTWPSWRNFDKHIIAASTLKSAEPNIVVRAHDGALPEAMTEVQKLLLQTPNRWIDKFKTLQELRTQSHIKDTAIVSVLHCVISLLIIVTALSIFAHVRFGIVTRHKQISIQRALGASKPQILHYYMLETFILAAIGTLSGVLLTILINTYLIDKYELIKVPMQYILFGGSAMMLLSQLATLHPIIQACRVSPTMITRIG
jgi:putative ABC transport system permease protein